MKIRFSGNNDIEHVMSFLGKHWASNHILSKNKVLLDWQHYDRKSDRYNFVIAVDSCDTILGTLGFIPTSHFDKELLERDTVWLTSWKVRESNATSGLGLQLHSFLQRNIPHEMLGTVGNNAHAAKIYKALGYTTGSLSQFYMLNDAKDSFTLAEVPLSPHWDRWGRRQRKLEFAGQPQRLLPLDLPGLRQLSARFSYVQGDDILPRKSVEYFVNRFLKHPIYDYSVYAVIDDNQPRGLLALRCAQASGQRALRLVDYHGDPDALARMYGEWQNLLLEFDAEYMDFCCHGPLESALQASGMSKLDYSGDVIIPNHFEPFLKKNVVINWAYKSPTGRCLEVFRADADQDRPNRIE